MARAAKKKTELKVVGGHGEIGHNSGATIESMNEESVEALTRQKAKIRSDLVAAEKAAKAKRMNFDKEIKAELGAKGLSDIKLLEQLATPEGEAEFREEMERRARVARWQGLAIGAQGNLFEEDRRPLRERAFDDGKRAAMDGSPCKPPHDSGDGHEGWVEGWHAGAAVVNNQKKEQEDGERLLRPVQNEASGPDEFDTAGEESFLNDEQEAPAEPVSPEPDPWDEPNDGAAADGKWPDDVAVEGAREEPEEL